MRRQEMIYIYIYTVYMTSSKEWNDPWSASRSAQCKMQILASCVIIFPRVDRRYSNVKLRGEHGEQARGADHAQHPGHHPAGNDRVGLH